MREQALAPKGNSIPSLFVPLPFDRYDSSLVSSIIGFTFAHTFSDDEERIQRGERKNFVVKFPFVTNREGLKFAHSFVDIFEELLNATTKFAERIPYAIIQPYIINRKEKKCVLLNGRFSHFAVNHVKAGPQRLFADDKDLPLIAENYLQELVAVCPGTITSGLVRVDMMCYRGKVVVNEFESLEALYVPEYDRDYDKDGRTKQFLQGYWKDIIISRVIREL